MSAKLYAMVDENWHDGWEDQGNESIDYFEVRHGEPGAARVTTDHERDPYDIPLALAALTQAAAPLDATAMHIAYNTPNSVCLVRVNMIAEEDLTLLPTRCELYHSRTYTLKTRGGGGGTELALGHASIYS